jgi:hypothetical protein
MSKNAIRAVLCSGLIVLAMVAIILFAGFRSGTRTLHSGDQSDLSIAGISVSDQAHAAQRQPSQSNLTEDGVLLKRIADAPEPSLFSVEQTADRIGNDPKVLFAYIHDHVRTQIYSGVLRGARGTLMGGAGNSWDQALLLAAMLRHQGKEVRFAHVHLTPEMAGKIVDRMFVDAARPRVPAAKPLRIPESLQRGGRANLAQIQDDSRAAQGDLLQALDRAHLQLGDTATTERQLESEAADHLFVEYRDGDRWIVLDPILEDAPGASVSSAAEYAPEIPDSFYHHVTIHIWIEQRHAQTLQQQEVFRFATPAATLSDAQVLLSHKFDPDTAGGWRATPVLQIDGHAYSALTFSDAGLIDGKGSSIQNSLAQAQQAISQLGQAMGPLGEGKKSAATPTSAAQTEFTAEWLEVEFTDPANHSETVRRELIDRIGAVARASKSAATAPLTPINVTKGIPLQLAGINALAFATGPLNPALAARHLSSAAGVIGDLQALKDARPVQNGSLSPENQEHLVRVLDQYPALLQASAESVVTLSQHVARGLRVGDSALLFYEATPRLVIASFDLRSGLVLDLRRNVVRVVAPKLSGADLVRANLVRSVADAAIEGDMFMPEAQARRIAGIDIFDRARTEGIQLVALRGGAPLASIHSSDLARARMASADAESLLVAPERTPSDTSSHFAWWKLDPSTGEAISTLDTGLNGFQDGEEEAFLLTRAISPKAYEVFGGVRYYAWNLRTGISPLAVDVGAPWSLCQEVFTAVVDALVELGEDIDLDAMTM